MNKWKSHLATIGTMLVIGVVLFGAIGAVFYWPDIVFGCAIIGVLGFGLVEWYIAIYNHFQGD